MMLMSRGGSEGGLSLQGHRWQVYDWIEDRQRSQISVIGRVVSTSRCEFNYLQFGRVIR